MKILKSLLILSFLFLNSYQISAQTPVFVSGTEGHKTYRIPAIVSLPNGELLAFAEGRVNGSGDFGDINIVLKRSNDGGKTWSEIATIVDYSNLQAANPAPVVDLLDPKYPNGKLFLFYNTGTNHEGEVRKGNGIREVWVKSSVDGGHNWSEAQNITMQTHKPKQTNINQAYTFSEDWRHYANTPGHALQISSGPYKGRIYVAANHSTGEISDTCEDYFAHGFYTDDHGKTFKLSETVNLAGSNESTAAELSNGGLLLNARNQKGDVRTRIMVISKNGGQSWDSVYFDHQLPDPVCQGTILNIGKNKGKNILAFCNAADTHKRDNLTLRISFDEGKTWTRSFVIDKAPENNRPDFTAYSDIVKLGKDKIGVLYERDNYSQIIFKVVKWR